MIILESLQRYPAIATSPLELQQVYLRWGGGGVELGGWAPAGACDEPLLQSSSHLFFTGQQDTLAEWLRRRPAKPMGRCRFFFQSRNSAGEGEEEWGAQHTRKWNDRFGTRCKPRIG